MHRDWCARCRGHQRHPVRHTFGGSGVRRLCAAEPTGAPASRRERPCASAERGVADRKALNRKANARLGVAGRLQPRTGRTAAVCRAGAASEHAICHASTTTAPRQRRTNTLHQSLHCPVSPLPVVSVAESPDLRCRTRSVAGATPPRPCEINSGAQATASAVEVSREAVRAARSPSRRRLRLRGGKPRANRGRVAGRAGRAGESGREGSAGVNG